MPNELRENQKPESVGENTENSFLREQIKDRPLNKKKLIRRTFTTAVMAVIFGLIACVTFLLLEPVISNLLYPEEETQVVTFPEDTEEMSPEEMLVDTMQQESQQNNVTEPSEISEDEHMQQLLENLVLDLDDYQNIYSALSSYADEMNHSMATVTGMSSDVDWLQNTQESTNQAPGLIIAENGRELLILVDAAPLADADSISVSFYDSTSIEGSIKAQNEALGLAVVAVNLSDLRKLYTSKARDIDEQITIATLGSSASRSLAGTPVIVLGSPMGTSGSLGYGLITSNGSDIAIADGNYSVLQTDIVGSQNARGVIFNLKGQVLGIVTNTGTTDLKNLIAAYGITDLKPQIEKLSNNEKAAYLGILGVNVTQAANTGAGVPYGAYITELEMDSPAMLAGIRQGDVITQFDEHIVNTYGEYTNYLNSCQPGDTITLTIERLSQGEYKEMEFTVTATEAQ